MVTPPLRLIRSMLDYRSDSSRNGLGRGTQGRFFCVVPLIRVSIEKTMERRMRSGCRDPLQPRAKLIRV